MKNVLFAFSIMVAIGFFVLTSPAAQSDESAFYMDATSLETAAVADAPAHSNVFSSFVHYIREKNKKGEQGSSGEPSLCCGNAGRTPEHGKRARSQIQQLSPCDESRASSE
jgi:hypothetical protein